MTDPNTVELGAHPGAAENPSLSTPEGEPEYPLFNREVSADGMVRLSTGDSVGINLGMGYVDDGREKLPVSLAAPTVYTNRELFLTEAETAEAKPDELAQKRTEQTTPPANVKNAK